MGNSCCKSEAVQPQPKFSPHLGPAARQKSNLSSNSGSFTESDASSNLTDRKPEFLKKPSQWDFFTDSTQLKQIDLDELDRIAAQVEKEEKIKEEQRLSVASAYKENFTEQGKSNRGEKKRHTISHLLFPNIATEETEGTESLDPGPVEENQSEIPYSPDILNSTEDKSANNSKTEGNQMTPALRQRSQTTFKPVINKRPSIRSSSKNLLDLIKSKKKIDFESDKNEDCEVRKTFFT